MTMPDERTRAVIQTREFLRELRGSTALPDGVRNEAKRVLRYYPTAVDRRPVTGGGPRTVTVPSAAVCRRAI